MPGNEFVRNNRDLGVGRFSLLLLSQIPPPRGGAGPRWDAGAPLDIVFHSVGQEDSELRKMAGRLLTLVRPCYLGRILYTN